MALLFTALLRYSITTKDGESGTVVDMLFDQRTWKARWLVGKAGGWLLGRKVLVHPSSIVRTDPKAGGTEHEGTIVVDLTRAALKDSPAPSQDEPVSQQTEMELYACPGSDPLWGSSGSFGEYSGDAAKGALGRRADQGSPSLRSCGAVIGYHVMATNGATGHVQDFLLDDHTWSIDSVIVDTKDWRSGQRVLLPPQAITGIGVSDQQLLVSISRDQIEASPSWT